MTREFNDLLWIFSILPNDYVVLDTETTGLPDNEVMPDIVSIGITSVKDCSIASSKEFKIRPNKEVSRGAQSIHGISNEEAGEFDSFQNQWHEIHQILEKQLIVIHNASFDWPILNDAVAKNQLKQLSVQGVFCSQKAAFPWALSQHLPCSKRGPSLDTLTATLGIQNLRQKASGLHGAEIDSYQTANVVEALRSKANRTNEGRPKT